MEPDPLQDPQPVKIVEERRDVFHTVRREHKSAGSVEYRLKSF